MKKLLLALSLFTTAAYAQEKCLSDILFQETAKSDPSVLKTRELLEEFTQSWIKQNGKMAKSASGGPPSFIIPVVFHVIHKGGAENITDAQIMSQMVSLNNDFRRLNADTILTPVPFQSIAADCEIEFHLAQLDPLGNCTNGINRIYSPTTSNARNNIKSLIYWPSNQYLNVWIVESIENSSGSPGIVAGFAQFPGGNPSTDGVVVRSEYLGTTGTAVAPGAGGRTLTHEVGHWLNLRHIWGDEPNCAQDDGVGDTPLQATYTFSICPTFPRFDACTPAGNGINFQNYMDYSDNECYNMYTQGQAARMWAAMNSSTSGRDNLSTPSNLTATGTDGTPATLCAPKADFIPRTKFICEGNSVTFKDLSWGGTAASRQWTFNGGSPATDTSAQPSVTYNAPGMYDVTLTSTNASGGDTKTITNHVIVSQDSVVLSVPYSEGFETVGFPYNDWFILNDNAGSEWEQTSIAAASGLYSLTVDNMSGGGAKGPDEFITPAFNFSNVTGTSMNFKLAFAYTSSATANLDKLIVYYSTNCGQTWTVRKTINGPGFQTSTTAFPTAFFPAPAQWRTETVSLSPPSISTQPNVRFRFEFTHDTGNNIYIDDINITGTITGVDEVAVEKANLNIYPNPSTALTYVSFTTERDYNVRIEVTDVAGRIVNVIQDQMPAGEHQVRLDNKMEKGVYFVRLYLDNAAITKRVVIQ